MKTRFPILALLLLSTAGSLAAQHATLTGVITDGGTKDHLVGTTVTIRNTSRGTVADANGRYTLFVPAGRQVVEFQFLGYRTQTVEWDFLPGEVKTLDVVMIPDVHTLEGVVVTAQARGQTAAIRSQLNSTSIMNAVSEEKLRELPDVNVADAIGRLPGLMIQRDGGEGQKIVIRGLDPKFNTVAINGMNAPSTSATDRSTDLNMISPDMIAGAEVWKANTADKDADGLGGTVNLIMRDAPSGPKVSVMGETGFHSQISDLNRWPVGLGVGRYKASLLASNRFANDRLGIILTAGLDKTDRSNDTFRGEYSVSGNVPTEGLDYTRPWLTGAYLEANLETRRRLNLNLNMDWIPGNGSKIKMSNLVSRMDRDRDVRQKRYDVEGNRLRFIQRDIESRVINVTNILQGEFNLWGTTLDVGVGRSESRNRMPYQHELEYRIDAPYRVNPSSLSYLAPYLVMDERLVDESDVNEYYMYCATFQKENAREVEYSTWLDWKRPFDLGERINGYIQLGGKYRGKERSLDTERHYERMDLSVATSVFGNMPGLTPSSTRDLIGITDLLDPNYRNHRFLNGKYPNLSYRFALDQSAMRNFYEVNKGLYQYTPTTMVRRDYSGSEELWAAYVMTELNFGRWVTFTPGLRYDYSNLRYSAFSGEDVPEEESKYVELELQETTDSEKFDYWLPQIHLRVKPLDWLDIRLAYTQTLSRPDYNLLAPRTLIAPSSSAVTWNRTNLKPIRSTNYDLIVTAYEPGWGLFTVSGFFKEIENFIYTRTAFLLDGTRTDPRNFDLNPATAGYSITYPLNSPYTATLKGLEFDLQLQFRRLNNFLAGAVFNANLTLMDSKMKYFETLRSRIRNPDYVPGENRPFLPVNEDVVYTDRLLNQPSLLVNVALGYDYKRFSGRVSCNHQGGVLVGEQHRPDGADVESTRPFTKFDAQFKYQATPRLSLYLTLSNFTNSSDRQRRDITDLPKRVEYYGSACYFGLRYDLFK